MRVHNQKAFSMIELVFVIIISGILAAVALPKFVGISNDSHIAKLIAFTGTLNRSVGASLWSGVQKNEPNQNGVLSTSTNYAAITEGVQIDTMPAEFTGLGTPVTISLANCMESNTTVPEIGASVGGLTTGRVAGTTSIGSKTYALGCIDGSLTSSPRFYLYEEGAGGVIVY